MTLEENAIVAQAQSAYQQSMYQIKDEQRQRELFRIGLLGLLECELGVLANDGE